MDFASLMKQSINSSAANTSNTNKYVKRSEIEAQRKELYLKEQAELERARIARLEKKRKHDDEEAERQQALKLKRHRLAEDSARRRVEEAAENERQRRKRLNMPELVEKELEDDGLLRKHLNENGEPQSGETSRILMSDGPIPTSLELLPEEEMKLPNTIPDTVDPYLLRQIASYFNLILSEWESALKRRSKEVKESSSGRQAYKNYTTAVSNLVPLFRKLESHMPDDILKPILEIANLSQSKRYVDANNAYLKLSIGTTAWPIGVTMVGIHERSAREKLHEDGGHIMSDETTRKMLQGIKRVLTFAQTRWPPDDLGQLMG